MLPDFIACLNKIVKNDETMLHGKEIWLQDALVKKKYSSIHWVLDKVFAS
jgi:hypothetical protein